MAIPDSNAVLKVLREAADFSERVGAKADAVHLQEFCNRFQQEPITFKVLRGVVAEEMNRIAIGVRGVLYDDARDARPGMQPLVEEHERIWVEFLKTIYPPEFSEMDISKFVGASAVEQKVVSYKGDPARVRTIVERSIAIVQEYSKAVGSGDFQRAYSLTDSGLRAWMTPKRFVGDHGRAAQDYHGPALEFLMQRINYVYADDTARKKSNTSVEGWPKGTAKENRRAAVGGFWIRDRTDQTGCAGTLWIAEESKKYRIAKFNFWRP
jgi:hypothetical protein